MTFQYNTKLAYKRAMSFRQQLNDISIAADESTYSKSVEETLTKLDVFVARLTKLIALGIDTAWFNGEELDLF